MLMQGTTHRPMRPHRPFVPLLGHSIPKPKEIDAHPSASMRVLLVSCRLTEESVLSHLCEWEYQREDLVQRHLSTNAANEDRTHDLGIMRPTRYRLRQPRHMFAGQKEALGGIEPPTFSLRKRRSNH